jgi:hypothetical protein
VEGGDTPHAGDDSGKHGAYFRRDWACLGLDPG